MPPSGPPWVDRPRCAELERTKEYRESYAYDRAGNLTDLRHQSVGNQFRRRFAHVPGTNRLQRMTIGRSGTPYTHDAAGNLTSETLSRRFEWDHSDRLKVFRTQAGDSEPSVETRYLYDAGGQRVKKLSRNQAAGSESTVYIDGLFEHHRRGDGPADENNHLHVLDAGQRVALVRVGPPHPDDRAPAVQHHLGDQLESSAVVVDGSGGFVNREEYTPYGETTFGSFAKKRYRFAGKERDEESGLSYHEARYYIPWLGRWASADPSPPVDGDSLYRYVSSNPLRLVDPTGRQDERPRLMVDKCTEQFPEGKQRTLTKWAEQRPFVKPTLERPQASVGLPPREVELGLVRGLTSWEEASPQEQVRRSPEEWYQQHNAELRLWDKQIARRRKMLSEARSREANALELVAQRYTLDAILTEVQRLPIGAGIVYLRVNARTGGLYVGQAYEPEDIDRNFRARMRSHDRNRQTTHYYHILWRGMVKNWELSFVEEHFIRAFGGPRRYGGRLENDRYEMNDGLYRMMGGRLDRLDTKESRSPLRTQSQIRARVRGQMQRSQQVRRGRR